MIKIIERARPARFYMADCMEEEFIMTDKIEGNDILSFEHYRKGRPFTGSCKGMRYRIVKEKAADEDDTDKFRVDVWPEPLCYEATSDDKIVTQRFAFTQDGYAEVVDYLNEMKDSYKI